METSQRSVITVSFVSSKKVATQNTLDCPKEEESCTVDHRFVYEYSTVVVKMIASLCIVLFEYYIYTNVVREYLPVRLVCSSARLLVCNLCGEGRRRLAGGRGRMCPGRCVQARV